jgi:hypothetical protein
MMKLVVTRQLQWPEGKRVVEVSTGGMDYTNPDALVPKYEGEFEEFDDPGEAVEAAIKICRKWREDGCKDAKVGFGSTGGFTMPFEGCSFKEAREWARKLAANMHCEHCEGKLVYDKVCRKWICPELGITHNSLGDELGDPDNDGV